VPFSLSRNCWILTLVFSTSVWILFFWLVVFRCKRFNAVSRYAKGRLTLLGAGVVSLILASITFFSEIATLYGGTVVWSGYVFANIFKSILLASLFSFIERLIRFLEDEENTQHGKKSQ
jgi:hypothetical protein